MPMLEEPGNRNYTQRWIIEEKEKKPAPRCPEKENFYDFYDC
jgi:hypothetical protein